MRAVQVTDKEAELLRLAIRNLIAEYESAVEKYGTAEYVRRIDLGTLNSWRDNANTLYKLQTKLV